MLGGKNTFQNFGDAVINSTGTSDPSPVICGARDNPRLHLVSRLRILDRQLRSFRQRLRQNDHRPGRAHRVRVPLHRLLPCHLHRHVDPQQRTLRAAPLFGGLLPVQRGPRRGCCVLSRSSKALIAPIPRNPSPAQPTRRRTPNRLPAVAFPSTPSRPNCSYRSPHWSTPAGAPASGHGPTPPCTRRVHHACMRVRAAPPPFGIVPLQADRHT